MRNLMFTSIGFSDPISFDSDNDFEEIAAEEMQKFNISLHKYILAQKAFECLCKAGKVKKIYTDNQWHRVTERDEFRKQVQEILTELSRKNQEFVLAEDVFYEKHGFHSEEFLASNGYDEWLQKINLLHSR